MDRQEKPLVSIITGYYNRKENLKESIQSVLEQTYPNFEYIVFDDCSTDGTSELIDEFAHPRLRVIKHKRNIGFTKGIIAAIAESKGELIAIHGAGDVSFPERIAKQVDLLEKNPQVGIVGCLLEDVSREGTKIHSPIDGSNKSHFTQGEVMYRKSLYYEVGGYNSLFKYGQFTILKLELLKISESAFVNEVLYRRIHFENGVTKNPKKRIEQKFYVKLGIELAEKGTLLNIDSSNILIRSCLSVFNLLRDSPQEDIFISHLRGNRKALFIYGLYRRRLISGRLALRILKKLIR
ncbi:glycosyltransferase family 2 protein [Olivibacter sitiensis]|uniref:glycosyltransferase family 2 protein n=1 Tax=Olivibacter sitiensis TaxID=376470 RepID=UPI00040C9D34|nr:glycosyltransferase [Olivibacter sitiensis]